MFNLNTPTYLGDGVYAIYDGWQFRLYTERSDGFHEIFLEDTVLQSFIQFVNAFRSPDNRVKIE